MPPSSWAARLSLRTVARPSADEGVQRPRVNVPEVMASSWGTDVIIARNKDWAERAQQAYGSLLPLLHETLSTEDLERLKIGCALRLQGRRDVHGNRDIRYVITPDATVFCSRGLHYCIDLNDEWREWDKPIEWDQAVSILAKKFWIEHNERQFYVTAGKTAGANGSFSNYWNDELRMPSRLSRFLQANM